MDNRKKSGRMKIARLLTGVMLAGAALFGISGCGAGARQIGGIMYPDYSEYYYANDYCGAFSEVFEKAIYNDAERLSELTGAQVVVAAVADTQGIPIDEYSLNLANAWGIGASNKNNGVLILISTEQKTIRLEVGKGIEGAVSAQKAGEILEEYAVPALLEGQWDAAAADTSAAVMRILYAYNGLEVPGSFRVARIRPGSGERSGSPADVVYEEAVAGNRTKAHGSGRFAGCGADRRAE